MSGPTSNLRWFDHGGGVIVLQQLFTEGDQGEVLRWVDVATVTQDEAPPTKQETVIETTTAIQDIIP